MLTPEGRAVFCEPGPRHSSDPMSQHEMRAYGVIENDIVIQDIWEKAKALGFEDIKLSVFMPQPALCSLDEFETLHSFEAATDILRRVYDAAYKPVYDGLRLFVLLKSAGIRDSRSRDGLQAEVKATLHDEGHTYRIVGTVKNTGGSTWLPSGQEPGAVNVGLALRLPDGTWQQDFKRIQFLQSPAPPDSTRDFGAQIPKDSVGDAEVYVDLVAEHIAWFSFRSGAPVRVK